MKFIGKVIRNDIDYYHSHTLGRTDKGHPVDYGRLTESAHLYEFMSSNDILVSASSFDSGEKAITSSQVSYPQHSWVGRD